MSSLNISIKCKIYVKFYSKSLKHTSFSTCFDNSRIQICCVKTIIITSTKNGCSFVSSLLVTSNFFVSLLVVKDKNYSRNMCILFCRPTQAQCFHDVLCWHLIFLLNPTPFHESITLQLRSLSLEDDITTLSHYKP